MNCKNLDLIVVGDKNWPGTVVYLEYLKRNGYKIKKLMLCEFYENPSFKNRLEKIIYIISPKIYKKFCSLNTEKVSSLVKELHLEFQKFFDFSVPLDLKSVDYTDLSDCIEEYRFWNFKDPDLLKIMLKNKNSFFLYVSGGIVPKNIFDSGINLVHVHPGYVPYVKGSDGFLWSLRERGRLGYSCFFMNEYIDGGDLIFRQELNLDDFSMYRPLLKDHYSEVYRAILSGYDPHLRAQTLIKALNKNSGEFTRGSIQNTSSETGREFFSMHHKLIKKTLMDYLK